MAIIFSTRLSNGQTPGETFTDSPRLIDWVRAEPYPAKLRLKPREAKSGLGGITVTAAKLSRAKKQSVVFARCKYSFFDEPSWEAFIFEGATFYYRR
jgi:hypothetical protein